jgi:hypothetical protein
MTNVDKDSEGMRENERVLYSMREYENMRLHTTTAQTPNITHATPQPIYKKLLFIKQNDFFYT